MYYSLNFMYLQCIRLLESSKQRRGRKTVRRNPSNTATFLEAEHVDFKWPPSEEQGVQKSLKTLEAVSTFQ